VYYDHEPLTGVGWPGGPDSLHVVTAMAGYRCYPDFLWRWCGKAMSLHMETWIREFAQKTGRRLPAGPPKWKFVTKDELPDGIFAREIAKCIKRAPGRPVRVIVTWVPMITEPIPDDGPTR
jgi:hypothetical protein